MSWILIFPQLSWVSILCPYVMSFDAIYMYITFTGKIIFVQVGTTHGLRENFWKMKTTHCIAVYPIERRNVCFFPSWSLGWPSKGTQLTSLFAKRGRFITGYNWTGNQEFFLVGKWCRRMKVKKAHITYIAACKVSSFCIIPFRQSSFALEQ